MKKWTFIVLVISMGIVFSGLLLLQYTYIVRNAKLVEEQFDDVVKRSLYQTILYIEEKEALIYLSETLVENGLVSTDSIQTYDFFTPRLKLSDKHGSASIEHTLSILRERFQQNFSRSKTILDQAVFRWLREVETKGITERVDFVEIRTVLESLLKHNGVNIPFEYSCVDKQGKNIYLSERIDPELKRTKEPIYYTQQLFPSEKDTRTTYLSVSFPTKKSYIYQSLVLFFPSLIMLVLVLVIFIVAIYIIWKQKTLNNMKNDFINNMTHEFKTPISSISLASQMLQDEGVGKTPETLKYMSNIIRDETKRLSLQVEKVLQMAMFERDKSILNITEMHINALVQDIVNTFMLKVKGKGGQITLTLKAENDFALVDEVHFTNIIYNLLDNALKYSDKAPLIEVTTENDKEGNLQITVEDNGIGIKKEDHKRVFEKFYRVSTGNLHNVKGFGMGLAYVKRMVEEHKGTIKIESQLNIGTKFIINIPTLKNYEL